MGDHVNGFELSGSEGPPAVGWLPDIFLAGDGYLVLSPSISGTGSRISQRRSAIETCGQWEKIYNSLEDTVDYWGELIRFCVRFGSGCIAFGGKGIQVFFFFFKFDILLY